MKRVSREAKDQESSGEEYSFTDGEVKRVEARQWPGTQRKA